MKYLKNPFSCNRKYRIKSELNKIEDNHIRKNRMKQRKKKKEKEKLEWLNEILVSILQEFSIGYSV